MNALIRPALPAPTDRRDVYRLLLFFGIGPDSIYAHATRYAPGRRSRARPRRQRIPGLWGRPESELWALYEQARANWRDRIRGAHPDRGGSLAESALLIVRWRRLEYLFRRHGIGGDPPAPRRRRLR